MSPVQSIERVYAAEMWWVAGLTAMTLVNVGVFVFVLMVVRMPAAVGLPTIAFFALGYLARWRMREVRAAVAKVCDGGREDMEDAHARQILAPGEFGNFGLICEGWKCSGNKGSPSFYVKILPPRGGYERTTLEAKHLSRLRSFQEWCISHGVCFRGGEKDLCKITMSLQRLPECFR